MNLTTSIGGIRLENPIFNASGPWANTLHKLKNIEASSAAAILSKTCTLKPNKGNSHPRLVLMDNMSFNAEGLGNLGVSYFAEHCFLKPYFVSVMVDRSLPAMLDLLKNRKNVCAIELNFGCPNTGQIFGYDAQIIDHVLGKIIPYPKPIGLKLPPFLQRKQAEDVIAVITKYPVAFITTSNTLGVAYLCEDEMACLSNDGFGGLGGSVLKPIALGNVQMICELLKKYLRADIAVELNRAEMSLI